MLRTLIALILLAVAASPLAAAQAADSYVLGPLDQIEVNIDNYPALKTTTRIGADGSVILPLVGPVKVGGLDSTDAANLIETFYVNGAFIKLPTVRIEIVDYQSSKVSVLGQVNTQGLIVLDRAYSVAEIIAKAGGLAADAADTALVTRPIAGGASQQLTINIGQMGSTAGSTLLHAGDVVFVPRVPTFSVIGAVNKAGTYPITTGMTVEQALAAAGDVARIGTRSRIRIRRGAAGATTVIAAQLDDRVQAGDVIIIRERLF